MNEEMDEDRERGEDEERVEGKETELMKIGCFVDARKKRKNYDGKRRAFK